MIKIRNPERIDKFTSELNRIWKIYYPDWRFGQLCSNFFGWLISEQGIDLFFQEENQMIIYLKEYCGEGRNGRSN